MRMQLAESLPRVQGDRVQLQQVLVNLIINAIEAMRDLGEEERELLISTRSEPDGVSVGVRDTGPGLSPERFEPFYTTKPKGMGLSLPLHHRSARWATVGEREHALRRHLSIHIARPHTARAS
jgi:C4-dicarboxylate-specific signal transduction histidine kinase